MSRLLPALALVGCTTSIHQATLSDLRPYGPHVTHSPVSASAEEFTILGFDADNSHVDEAWEGLQQECGLGTLTGIVTETSTQLGFFSWTNKITFRALCVTAADELPEAEEAPPAIEGETEDAPEESE